MILIIAGVIALKLLSGKKGSNSLAGLPRTREEKVNLETQLSSDLENGKISADTYIDVLANSYGADGELLEEYASMPLGIRDLNYLIEETDAHIDELSDETVLKVLRLFFNTGTGWSDEFTESYEDLDVSSGNQIKLASASDPYIPYNIYDRTGLDRAVISENNHFIVYYTENGFNGTTREYAEKIADYLEDDIRKYEELTGIKYQYEPHSYEIANGYFQVSRNIAKRVLKKEGIDGSYADTAMPVYISATDSYDQIATGEADVLAYYISHDAATAVLRWLSKFNDLSRLLLGDDPYYLGATAYQFPNITVSKFAENNNNNLRLGVAHEFFHHFQPYICGNGEYGECREETYQEGLGDFHCTFDSTDPSNVIVKSENYKACNGGKTSTEGAANLASALINNDIKSTDTEWNHFSGYGAERYDVGPESSRVDGYDTWLYLYYYSQIVPDGVHKVFESNKYRDPMNYLMAQLPNKETGQQVMNEYIKNMFTIGYPYEFMYPIRDGELVEPKQKATFVDDGEIHVDETVRGHSVAYYANANDFDENHVLHLFRDKDKNSINFITLVFDGAQWKEIAIGEELYIPMAELKPFSEFAIVAVDGLVNGVNDTGLYHYEFIDRSDAVNLDGVIGEIRHHMPSWLEAKKINCHSEWIEDDEEDSYKETKMSMDYTLTFKDESLKGLKIYGRMEPQYKEEYFSWAFMAVAVWQWVTDVQSGEYNGSMFWYIPDDDGVDFNWLFYKNEYEYMKSVYSDINKNDKTQIINAMQNDGFVCNAE